MRSLVLSLAVALPLAAALPLLASPASADIPPPIGYVEQCTPARQQLPGRECVGCSSYFGSLQKCPELLVGSGFTKACQSHGASTWTEVWCRPAGGSPLSDSVSQQVERPTPAELQVERLRRVAWIAAPLIGFTGLVVAGWRLRRRRRASRSVDAGPSRA